MWCHGPLVEGLPEDPEQDPAGAAGGRAQDLVHRQCPGRLEARADEDWSAWQKRCSSSGSRADFGFWRSTKRMTTR